jgi:eukaryotic-like serine/threonine-protein kinase
LKRILAEGAKVDARSDAEWAYLRGLRLAQAGDTEGARRIWRDVGVAFGSVETELRWVKLSQVGLAALERPENCNTHGPPDRVAFDAALKHAKMLKSAGKIAEAASIFRALLDLFRDDPAASEAILQATDGK